MGFPGDSVVKNRLPMQKTQETWVGSLGREDPLEEGMQPTPVFLPGESQGQRSLAGYCQWVTKSQTCLSTNTCYLSDQKSSIILICKTIKCRYRHGSKYMMSRQIGPPGGAVVKNLHANAGDARDVVSAPGLGRSPE